jgi:hypothetical protein
VRIGCVEAHAIAVRGVGADRQGSVDDGGGSDGSVSDGPGLFWLSRQANWMYALSRD